MTLIGGMIHFEDCSPLNWIEVWKLHASAEPGVHAGQIQMSGPGHGFSEGMASAYDHQLVHACRHCFFHGLLNGRDTLSRFGVEIWIVRQDKRMVIVEPAGHLFKSAPPQQQPAPCCAGAKMSAIRRQIPWDATAGRDEAVLGYDGDQRDSELLHGLKSGSGGGGDHSGCSRMVANSKSIRQKRPSMARYVTLRSARSSWRTPNCSSSRKSCSRRFSLR